MTTEAVRILESSKDYSIWSSLVISEELPHNILLCEQYYQSPPLGIRLFLVPFKAKDNGDRTLVGTILGLCVASDCLAGFDMRAEEEHQI